MNYYNEFDPAAAAWLRELIANNLIAPGDVDERSIEDVRPVDLRGYVQCHFFAGIGGWAYALDLAGWPRDRPVWTGSCPCQPFSAAGARAGFEDERHLWPAWQHLIAQCRPAVVFGEQVASKAADAWVDLVHADMEGMGYAFGCIPFPAAGVGAPHIRDRNYWVADAAGAGGPAGLSAASRRYERFAGAAHDGSSEHACAIVRSPLGGLAYTYGGDSGSKREQPSGQQRQQSEDGGVVRLADPDGRKRDGVAILRGVGRDWEDSGRAQGGGSAAACGDDGEGLSGPLHGFWRNADWLLCRDGKWRPVEPGTQPLATGLPARVGRLRGYGNAIVPQAAAEFVRAYLEARANVTEAA